MFTFLFLKLKGNNKIILISFTEINIYNLGFRKIFLMMSINIFVSDMKLTLDFYSQLGFTFTEKDYTKNYVKVNFQDVSLCFYSFNIVQEYFNDNSIDSSNKHSFELSFRLEKPIEVDQLYYKLTKAGFKSFKEPSDSDWDQRVAFVVDPNNNLIELCAFLTKSN